MKCSSRRNCNDDFVLDSKGWKSLNEVQFPKELQHRAPGCSPGAWRYASMKCSSRRNCNHYAVAYVYGDHSPQ